jgi:tetratricopeptide (TPR) repeat protein
MKPITLFLGCVAAAALSSPGNSMEPSRPRLAPSEQAANGREASFDLRAASPAAPVPRLGGAGGAGDVLSTAGRGPGGRAAQRPLAEREQEPAKIDESALRFYASQNDAARVSMEIKRIKALHPSWEPPANLFDEARDPASEQKLWDLFAAGRLDDIRAVIEETRAGDPHWRPSEEFVRKFERAEVRLQLVAASEAKDAPGVLSVAEANPDMLVCSDLDVMWRVAEALVHTGAPERAQELYRFVLTRCTDPAGKLATMQKALELLPAKAVKALIATARGSADSAKDIEGVQLDLMRRHIGTVASDATAEPVPPAELRNFEALVAQRKLASDAILLGWFRYAQKDWPGAAQWFKQAMEWERQPKAAEGYALSLRQQGQLKDAETVAFEWRDGDPLIAKLYIEIVATALTGAKAEAMEPERLERTEQVTDKAKSATGAQALGWHYYNGAAFQKAVSWFAKAVAWEQTETNVLGLALAAHRTRNQALFKQTVAQHGRQFPAVAALRAYDRKGSSRATAARSTRQVASRAGAPAKSVQAGGTQAGGLAEDAVRSFKNGQYREALALLDKRGKAREDHGLGVIRGWALYHLNQYDKAREQFAQMDKKQSTRDTQYGLYYSGTKLDPTHLGD